MLAQFAQNRSVVAPFKYYFLLEETQCKLVTTEYAQVGPAALTASADLVIGPQGAPPPSFAPAATIGCAVRQVRPLPASFYTRSVFDETAYRGP